MTDEMVSDAGLQGQASAAPETPVNAPPETSQSDSDRNAGQPEASKQAEKTYTQAQVNAIAAKESRKAAEQAAERARSEFLHSQQQSQQSAPSVGGMPQMSQGEIQQMIRQEAFNMSREHQAKQIEDNWLGAMDAERAADPEFADLYEALNIEAQPGLIVAMQGMENKAKVVKDLAQNPAKYSNILMLANSGAFKLAERELYALSKSIQANENAKKGPKADAPLGQLKSSNIGGDDGNYSVADYQKMDWLRG